MGGKGVVDMNFCSLLENCESQSMAYLYKATKLPRIIDKGRRLGCILETEIHILCIPVKMSSWILAFERTFFLSVLETMPECKHEKRCRCLFNRTSKDKTVSDVGGKGIL